MFIRLTFVTLMLSIATGSQASVNQSSSSTTPQGAMADVSSGLDTESTKSVSGIFPLYPNKSNEQKGKLTVKNIVKP